MVREADQERLQRLKEKHADGLLLWKRKNGYELSPPESELVLESAKGILLQLICTLWERGVSEADIAQRTNHHLKSVGR